MDKMMLKFCAQSKNEAFARTCVSAFILPLNPSLDEIDDIKTAVSEAVTNAVVHAYDDESGEIVLECEILSNEIHIKITDYGKGIENIDEALEPYWTTRQDDERSGMGFTIMKTFMDELEVKSKPNNGTVVRMMKKIAV